MEMYIYLHMTAICIKRSYSLPFLVLLGFIAKTLLSWGPCFLPSCLGAGNYGSSERTGPERGGDRGFP